MESVIIHRFRSLVWKSSKYLSNDIFLKEVSMMALDIICPHCKKKVIESYRIIIPYLYGSKIRKCPKCGGEIFDNRWREVAIQGFDPIQDTEKK